jgi:Fe2+ or Zn2+ uptake regulation protein
MDHTIFHCTECAETFERDDKRVATMVHAWDAQWDWYMSGDNLNFFCPSCWKNRGKMLMLSMHQRIGNQLPDQR